MCHYKAEKNRGKIGKGTMNPILSAHIFLNTNLHISYSIKIKIGVYIKIITRKGWASSTLAPPQDRIRISDIINLLEGFVYQLDYAAVKNTFST